MWQSEAFAGGDNENLAMATHLCMCVSINTHLLIVELSNFKNKIEMKAFIPRSLYSGGDDISAHDNFKKVKEIIFAHNNTNIQQQTQIQSTWSSYFAHLH